LCNGKTSGQATLVSIQYARKPPEVEEGYPAKAALFFSQF
jgi:hypothetical protein